MAFIQVQDSQENTTRMKLKINTEPKLEHEPAKNTIQTPQQSTKCNIISEDPVRMRCFVISCSLSFLLFNCVPLSSYFFFPAFFFPITFLSPFLVFPFLPLISVFLVSPFPLLFYTSVCSFSAVVFPSIPLTPVCHLLVQTASSSSFTSFLFTYIE